MKKQITISLGKNFPGWIVSILPITIDPRPHRSNHDDDIMKFDESGYLFIELTGYRDGTHKLRVLQRNLGIENCTTIVTGDENGLLFNKIDSNFTAAKIAFAVECGCFKEIKIQGGEILLTKRTKGEMHAGKNFFRDAPSTLKLTSEYFHSIHKLFDPSPAGEERIKSLINHFIYAPWIRKSCHNLPHPNALFWQWSTHMQKTGRQKELNRVIHIDPTQPSPLKAAIEGCYSGKSNLMAPPGIRFKKGRGTLLDHLKPLEKTRFMHTPEKAPNLIEFLIQNGAMTGEEVQAIQTIQNSLYWFSFIQNSRYRLPPNLLPNIARFISSRFPSDTLALQLIEHDLKHAPITPYRKHYSEKTHSIIQAISEKTDAPFGWHVVPKEICIDTHKDYLYEIQVKPGNKESSILEVNVKGRENQNYLFSISLRSTMHIELNGLVKGGVAWHLPASEFRESEHRFVRKWIDDVQLDACLISSPHRNSAKLMDYNAGFLRMVQNALRDEYSPQLPSEDTSMRP